jgi:hypothetical protein
MAIRSSNIAANKTVLYREVHGASLPAWAWREMHTARTAAGDVRSAILLVNDGAETIAMMAKEDLDMLITPIREEGDQA